MKKEEELIRSIPDMIKETKAGRLSWRVECQTTEYNKEEDKPKVTEDGVTYTVDECFVSYYCEYKGKEFLMITYEMIHSAGSQKNTTNLVFLPPLGIRVFELNALLPYAITADNMLTYHVHQLWLTLLEEQKSKPELIRIDATERKLTIED